MVFGKKSKYFGNLIKLNNSILIIYLIFVLMFVKFLEKSQSSGEAFFFYAKFYKKLPVK